MPRFLKQHTFHSLIAICSVILLLLGAAYWVIQAQIQRQIEVEVDKAVADGDRGQQPQIRINPLRDRATLLNYITEREALLQKRAQETPDERAVAMIYFKNRTVPLAQAKLLLQKHNVELLDLQRIDAEWEEFRSFVRLDQFLATMERQGIQKDWEGFINFLEEQDRSLIRQTIKANQKAVDDMAKQGKNAEAASLRNLISRNQAYYAFLEENGLQPISVQLETTYSRLKSLSGNKVVQFVNLLTEEGRNMSGHALHRVFNQ